MSSGDEDFEGLWIWAGPPDRGAPGRPGCLGLLAIAAVIYVIASSGLWAPILLVALGWGLLQGRR